MFAQAPVEMPPETRLLLPGDELITTCTYSGVGRTEVTRAGQSTYDEMVRRTPYGVHHNVTYRVPFVMLADDAAHAGTRRASALVTRWCRGECVRGKRVNGGTWSYVVIPSMAGCRTPPAPTASRHS